VPSSRVGAGDVGCVSNTVAAPDLAEGAREVVLQVTDPRKVKGTVACRSLHCC